MADNFDPFTEGGAVEVMDRPKDAAPDAFDPFTEGGVEVMDRPKDAAPDAFDPFAEGAAEVKNPVGDVHPWTQMYAGIDGMDQRLTPEQRTAFGRLDAISKDPQEARAAAINQAYLQQNVKGLSPSAITGNWQAVKDSYAESNFGTPYKNITDKTLYGLIGKRIQETNEAQESQGEIKPWTWKDTLGSDIYSVKKGISDFWEGLNKPIVKIPEAPKNLPNRPEMGIWNPALVGGVYNALRPLVEGMGSPLGVGTAVVGAELKAASAIYPLAKTALATMTGVFTGIMGYGTVKTAIKAPDVLKDPNATFEDKVTAVASPVANAAATLMGALGTALEMFPEAEQPPILKELEGKNAAQAAQVLRREAQTTDIPGHSDFLNDAAHELERIATPKDTAAAKLEADNATIRAKLTEIEGKSPAAAAEPATAKETAVPETLTGIKNEAIDAELKEMGLPEATHGEKTSFNAELDKAAAMPEGTGAALVDELTTKARPVTATEDAILIREMNRLRIARNTAEEEFNAASKDGDAGDQMAAKVRVNQARDAYQKAADVVTKVGTKNAQALALRRMMIKEDYSLASLERQEMASNAGKPLSAEQETAIRDLHKQLTDAQAKIEAYDKAQLEARANPPTAAPRRPTPTRKIRQFMASQAGAARERIKARLAEGRQSAGFDPSDVADHAIVGADYIAKGVTKFADWSVAMVNELGEGIRPYLDQIFKQAIDAEDNGRRLQAYKVRMAAELEKGRERLAAGDVMPRARRKLEMDPEAINLRGEVERVKRKIQLRRTELEQKNMTPLAKAKELALAVNRAGVLSRVATILKLSAIIAERTVSTPIRQGIGLAVSKVMPEVARQARFEDVPTVGGYVRSEAKALTAMLTKGLPGAWDILRMKDTDLQAVLEKEHLPPGALSYPSHIHAALHYPVQVADYARRLQLINERDLRSGVNLSEPVNQLRNMQEAWEYSKRSVFLQDNKLVNAYKAGVKVLQSPDKVTGKPNPIANFIAFGLQAENPVLKVPANFAEEMTEHVLGLLDPPVRLAIKGVGGFKGLTYGEADMIMRHVKNGFLGAALVALGFLKYKQVGGFYQEGERRKESDAQAGQVKVGGSRVPKLLMEDTALEAMQAGATMHRTIDSIYRLNDPQKKGFPAGLLAVAAGLAEETPFVRDATLLGKILDPRQREHAVAADIASKLVPGFVQEMAAEQDKKTPYNPFEQAQSRAITAPDFSGALKQNLEKEIPGLRKNLPKRNPTTTYR